MGRIDDLDLKILSELSKDASISVPRLSKKLISMLQLFIVE
jgi:Lrp/AsnC family transcriptional regulator for asnA, asnC and gidA